MTIVFDLDHTLLDTTLLMNEMGKILEPHGIPPETFRETYLGIALKDDGINDYRLEAHLERMKGLLTCSGREAEKRLRSVVERTGDFLYPHAETLLVGLAEEGHDLVLLTHGNPTWQKLKVDKAGIAGLFSKSHYVPGMKHEMEGFLDDREFPLVMVNDNGKEIMEMRKRWPKAFMIAVSGPKGPPEDPAIPVAGSLLEVGKIIREL